jgi:hypothetical protein
MIRHDFVSDQGVYRRVVGTVGPRKRGIPHVMQSFQDQDVIAPGEKIPWA